MLMKQRFTFIALLSALVALAGCGSGTATLLPNVSGKAGEVIVVMDKDNWEGDLGSDVRNELAADCPYLAQREPLYNLVNVSPSGFADLFKVHRNIVIFNIDPQVQEPGIAYRNNVWARPQCVIQISAESDAAARELFADNIERVMSTLEQAERDRVIANSILYEDKSLAAAVTEMVGGSPHFPSGYKLKKKTDDFIWISDDKQYSIQGVFVYKYPAEPNDNFTQDNIIAHRNAFLEANVPGMFENTWMTTGTYITPSVEFISFRGRQFAQTRGFWEVHNDFMGGPFVSHSFYGPGGKDIIVVEAFVYAPKYDKRQYLRQTESIIYSFEWAKDEKEKKEKQ